MLVEETSRALVAKHYSDPMLGDSVGRHLFEIRAFVLVCRQIEVHICGILASFLMICNVATTSFQNLHSGGLHLWGLTRWLNSAGCQTRPWTTSRRKPAVRRPCQLAVPKAFRLFQLLVPNSLHRNEVFHGKKLLRHYFILLRVWIPYFEPRLPADCMPRNAGRAVLGLSVLRR